MFLKLNQIKTNSDIYVNFDTVYQFIKDDEYTTLIYVDGFICVKETPEEIIEMLKCHGAYLS